MFVSVLVEVEHYPAIIAIDVSSLVSGVCLLLSSRRGGGPLTPEEETSFQQLVRVTVHHFLPFVVKCFSSLFTKSTLTALTLTTPLSSRLPPPPPSSRASSEWEELDVAAMATPLRPLCPVVFEELEQMAQDQVTSALDHVTEDEDHVTNHEDGESTVGGDDTSNIANRRDTDHHEPTPDNHMTTVNDRVTTAIDHVTVTGDQVTALATTLAPSPSLPAPVLTPADTATP